MAKNRIPALLTTSSETELLAAETGAIATGQTLRANDLRDESIKEMAPQVIGQRFVQPVSVKKLAKQYEDSTSEGALRALIWNAEAYEKYPKPGLRSNGFLRVIVRPPGQRRVLLDPVEYQKWLISNRYQ
jgi:hypothetical protein